jgi:molybdopterin-guanine dinucleotide biosynthesis protein A
MGRPKHELTIGGATFFDRILQTMAARCRSIIVVDSADRPKLSLEMVAQVGACDSIPTIEYRRDERPDAGALHGLRIGLESSFDESDLAKGSNSDRVLIETVFVTAVDTPLLTSVWIDALVARYHAARSAGREIDAVVAESAGRLHPLSALYGRSALDKLTDLERSGERRLQGIRDALSLDVLSEREVDEIEPGRGAIFNVNNPDDYRRLIKESGLNPR